MSDKSKRLFISYFVNYCEYYFNKLLNEDKITYRDDVYGPLLELDPSLEFFESNALDTLPESIIAYHMNDKDIPMKNKTPNRMNMLKMAIEYGINNVKNGRLNDLLQDAKDNKIVPCNFYMIKRKTVCNRDSFGYNCPSHLDYMSI